MARGVVVPLLVAVVAGVSAGGAGASGWPQAGHDAARTGFNPHASLALPFSSGWGNGASYLGGNGVVEAGGVVLGVGYAGVDALDARSGVTLWHHDGGADGVAMSRQMGYAVGAGAGGEPTLSAYRLADGALLWRQPGGPAGSQWCDAPALKRDAVYVSTVSYDRSVDPPRVSWGVRAYDPVVGRSLWRRSPTFTRSVCSPSVAGRSVYVVADADGHARLVALDEVTGRQRWSLVLPAGVASDQAPMIAGGRLYLRGTVPGSAGGLVIVNLALHAIERVVGLTNDFVSALAIDGDGHVLVAGCGSLTKLDAAGNNLGNVGLHDEGCGGQSIIVANGLAFVTGFQKTYVFNTQSLALVTSIDIYIANSSPIIADDQFIIGGYYGVRALRGMH
jgi:hypothetical protein